MDYLYELERSSPHELAFGVELDSIVISLRFHINISAHYEH